jgi:hypothetical protein
MVTKEQIKKIIAYQVVASDKELEQVKTIDDLIQLILNKINVSQ